MKYLSKYIIQKLSYSTSFERGEKYYKQGRVIDYHEDADFITANVIGTDIYHVKINQTKWEHSCNCLAYNEKSFCKHEVAMLLTKLYGKIETNNKPKIKKQNSERLVTTLNEFTGIIENISKENLTADIVKCAEDMPDLISYFRLKYQKKDERFFQNVESSITILINSLKRIRYGAGYSNKIYDICYEIDRLIQNIPLSKQSSNLFLKAGYKLDESLSSVDDSYGTIQKVIDILIEKAVLFLNSTSSEDLDIFYEFISKESYFDYDHKIVNEIIEVVNNEEVLSKFVTKLEKTLFRKDPDFNINQEDVVYILMKYYKKTNLEKYDELAKEYFELGILIQLDYLEQLNKQKRYNELIEYGMPLYGRYDVCPIINNALFNTGNINELINLIKSRPTSMNEINALSKLKSITGFSESKEFDELFTIMLKNCPSIYSELDLLASLEKYEEMKDVILKNPNTFNEAMLMERYALKFSLFHPEISIELYKGLIDIELKKIRTSHYYKPLMEYLTMIKELGGNDFVIDLSKNLIKNSPSKKKLIEELKQFCN